MRGLAGSFCVGVYFGSQGRARGEPRESQGRARAEPGVEPGRARARAEPGESRGPPAGDDEDLAQDALEVKIAAF